MMQQVNLLTDELRPRREPLTLNQLFMLWVGFAVILLLVSSWSGVDTWQLATKEDETREQWRLLKETNDRLRASYSATADPALEARVAALRLEQEEREQLVTMLADYHNQQALGFSGYLSDLSSHGVSDMWLSEIAFETGGQWIRLKGMTTDPARVPEFLHQLSEDSSFDGHLFDAFELKEAESGLIEFAIDGPGKAG